MSLSHQPFLGITAAGWSLVGVLPKRSLASSTCAFNVEPGLSEFESMTTGNIHVNCALKRRRRAVLKLGLLSIELRNTPFP
jgi:hypothetical protein